MFAYSYTDDSDVNVEKALTIEKSNQIRLITQINEINILLKLNYFPSLLVPLSIN